VEVLAALAIALVPASIALATTSGRRVDLWLAALIGGGGWLAALVLRVPILSSLNPRSPTSGYVASVLAGLFEESLRFVILRTELLRRLSTRGATALGLGWGLAEAALLYALPVVATSATQGYGLVELLPGAIERNFAISIHLSLALLVSVNPGSLRLLAVAVALHAAINCLALASLNVFRNVWVVEGVIAAVAVALLVTAVRLVRRFRR